MQITDISKDITKCEIYKGDPAVSLKRVCSIENGDMCNLTEMTTGLHNGTHADAPLHFISNGDSIDNADLSAYIGMCSVINVKEGALDTEYVAEHFPKNAKRVLIKGNGKAYFTQDGAKTAAESGIVLIGTDSLSVGTHGAQTGPHTEFLKNNIAVIENLSLENADEGEYFLSAQPLKIGSAEAAPLRAVLIKDIDEYLRKL